MNYTEPQARKQFGDLAVDSMHELAQLMYISRSLREIRPQFKKHPDLDFQQAKPLANQVLKSTASAATDLLLSVLRGRDLEDLQRRINQVRAEHAPTLHQAAIAAEELAKQEAAAITIAQTVQGNFVRLRVQVPLQQLAAVWAEPKK